MMAPVEVPAEVLAAVGDASAKAFKAALGSALGSMKNSGAKHLSVATAGLDCTGEHAQALVAAGAHVIATGRRAERLTALAAELASWATLLPMPGTLAARAQERLDRYRAYVGTSSAAASVVIVYATPTAPPTMSATASPGCAT